MPRWAVLLLLLLLDVAAARASGEGTPAPGTCAEKYAPLAMPPVIQKNHAQAFGSEKVTDLTRLKQASRIVGAHAGEHAGEKPLSQLPDGVYIFLIDRENRIGVLERAIGPAPGAPLVPGGAYIGSHEGLATLLAAQFKENPEVVAAGEFIIRGGKIAVLSNKSGTFPGGGESLAFARKELEKAGLPIRPSARVHDYSKGKASAHESVKEQVVIDLRYQRDPELKLLLDETRSAMNEFRRRYPTDEKAIEKLMDPNLDPADFNLLGLAIQFRSEWEVAVESDAFRIESATRGVYGRNEFRRMLRCVRELSAK